jgi:hypothetical protein
MGALPTLIDSTMEERKRVLLPLFQIRDVRA